MLQVVASFLLAYYLLPAYPHVVFPSLLSPAPAPPPPLPPTTHIQVHGLQMLAPHIRIYNGNQRIKMPLGKSTTHSRIVTLCLHILASSTKSEAT